MHALWPAEDVYVPAAQSTIVVAPLEAVKVPAGADVQTVAPGRLYEPAEQEMHAPPLKYCPPAQLVTGGAVGEPGTTVGFNEGANVGAAVVKHTVAPIPENPPDAQFVHAEAPAAE